MQTQMQTGLHGYRPDLVISLGPHCRNTFNLRRIFGTERAYPFDWWITPMGSALHMLDPGFRFAVQPDDLVLLETGAAHNTLYDRRLHVLHHHDFERVQHKMRLPDEATLATFNEKYRFLFARMQQNIAAAERVLFVSDGLQAGLAEAADDSCTTPGLAGPVSLQAASERLAALFGGKAQLLAIAQGDAAEGHEPLAHWMRRLDDGTRLYPPGHRFAYAEPVNLYAGIIDALDIRHPTPDDQRVERIPDPEDELQR